MKVKSVEAEISELDETNVRLFDTIKSHVKANKNIEKEIQDMEIQ